MLKLRGHHLLCLQGFRGHGYSPEFVSNMQSILNRLRESPDIQVRITISPDDICAACPHLSKGGCARGEGENRVSHKDAEILKRLAISPEEIVTASEAFSKTGDEFSTGIEDVCGKCSWFGLGYCAEGIQERRLSSTTRLILK